MSDNGATTWTKERALAELDRLVSTIDHLTGLEPFSTDHVRWQANCQQYLEEVFGPASRYFQSFGLLTWTVRGSVPIPTSPFDLEAGIKQVLRNAYRADLEMARGILLGALDYLKRVDVNAAYRAKDTGPESSLILKILNLADLKLRKVIRTQPEKEQGVQDAFETLLVGADIAHSRETESIEYSSKTYKPDFSFPKIDLAVEMKLCNRSGREKEIIGEINDDILAYNQKFSNLVFIVYDLGFIRDVERFVGSFEAYRNVTVRVVKQ